MVSLHPAGPIGVAWRQDEQERKALGASLLEIHRELRPAIRLQGRDCEGHLRRQGARKCLALCAVALDKKRKAMVRITGSTARNSFRVCPPQLTVRWSTWTSLPGVFALIAWHQNLAYEPLRSLRHLAFALPAPRHPQVVDLHEWEALPQGDDGLDLPHPPLRHLSPIWSSGHP